MSSVQSVFSCQLRLATNLRGFAATCVLLSQLWEVNMELRGEPISGDIFTPDLPSGYQTEATDEESAKEEASQSKEEQEIGYSNADVMVKLRGWDPTHATSVAQASLSALKQLIISERDFQVISRRVST